MYPYIRKLYSHILATLAHFRFPILRDQYEKVASLDPVITPSFPLQEQQHRFAQKHARYIFPLRALCNQKFAVGFFPHPVINIHDSISRRNSETTVYSSSRLIIENYTSRAIEQPKKINAKSRYYTTIENEKTIWHSARALCSRRDNYRTLIPASAFQRLALR